MYPPVLVGGLEGSLGVFLLPIGRFRGGVVGQGPYVIRHRCKWKVFSTTIVANSGSESTVQFSKY